MGMACPVLWTVVSLGLANPHLNKARRSRNSAAQQLADKLLSHLYRRPIEKRRSQNFAFFHTKKQKTNISYLGNRAVWSQDRDPLPRSPYEPQTVQWGLAFQALRTFSRQNIRKESFRDRVKPPD